MAKVKNPVFWAAILAALPFVALAADPSGQTLPNLSAAGAAARADLVPTSQSSGALTKQTAGAIADLAQITCSQVTNAGTVCTINTGTSGGTVGLLNANKTDSGSNTFSGTLNIFSGAIRFSGLSAGTQVSCLGLDSSNNIVLNASSCGSGGGGSGTVTSVALTMPGVFSVSGSPVTTSGTLAVTASGTSGGVPYFNASNTMASSGALTANLPVIGGGAGAAPSVGTRSGNTTAFVTTTGAQTSGDCVKIDASGNHVANGTSCGGGSGSVTSLTSTGNNIVLTPTTITTTGSIGLTVPLRNITSSAAIVAGDMGGVVNLGGTTGTLTINSISSTYFASGMSVCYSNNGASGNWTLASTPTVVGLPSTTLAPGAGGCLISNGTSLYWQPGVPGTPLVAANNLSDLTSASTARANLGLGTAALINTPITLGNGGVGITSGTSGGVPYFNSTSTVASSGALTANLPVIGGGAGAAPTVGARSGNTTTFATTTGTLTNGDCVSIDASGNLVAAGGACTTGGGGGTVASGAIGALGYYASAGTTISGAASTQVTPGSLTLGSAGSVLGTMKLAGSTAGTLTIVPSANSSSYTLTLPENGGTNNYVLATNGSGTTSWVAQSGGGGGTVYPTVPGFRLSAASANYVPTTTITSTTLYWTLGSTSSPSGTRSGSARYTLYNGSTAWVNFFSSTELSLALTCTSGNNYDVFVDYNGGSPVLALSAAWTNASTRADALVLQDGFFVKSGTTTSLWVGTIRCNASNATEDSAANRFVWNAFNQVNRSSQKVVTTDSTYGTSTYRYYNNDSANHADFVTGSSQQIAINLQVQTGAGGAASCQLDWTSGAPTENIEFYNANNTPTGDVKAGLMYSTSVAAGYHYTALTQAGFTGASAFASMACYNGIMN